jgi:hypothetical protein
MTRAVGYTTSMRSAARVGAAVILAAALTACSGSSSPRSAPAPASNASSAPTSFTELAARIITNVPSGFELQPDSVGSTGPSTLQKAIDDDGRPDAERALRSEGFVRGYQRLWGGTADAQIIVFLSQFETAAGARQAFERDSHDYASELPPGVKVEKFAVPGVPAHDALGIAGADSTGAAGIVYFTTDVYNVQINCNTTTPQQLQARSTAIAQAQFNRLNR